MRRVMTSEIDLALGGEVDLIFAIAVHSSVNPAQEEVSFTTPAGPAPFREIVDHLGNRLHRVAGSQGPLRVHYRAVVDDPSTADAVDERELIAALRPSRYAQSDELFAQARTTFHGLSGRDLVDAVRTHVTATLAYAPDGTVGTDSAVTTLRTGRGVCRDFAHVVIALLRAMDMPARYAACYAPGLRPMDFHAVAEAYVDGAWHVIDATELSDPSLLVRIGTGRDAADCAFLSSHGRYVGLDRLVTDAWLEEDGVRVDPDVTGVDRTALVRIA